MPTSADVFECCHVIGSDVVDWTRQQVVDGGGKMADV